MQFREIRHDENLTGLESAHCLGRVVGVYDKCFHLLLPDQRLVTVFGAVADMMPMSICTDAAPEHPFASLRLREGAQASICGGFFSSPAGGFVCRMGGEAVSLRRSALAVPPMPESFADALLRRGKRCGVGRWLPQWIEFLRTGGPLPDQAAALLRFAALLAVADGGESGLESALLQVVGMGVGLTPSADDMLCGVAAAAWLWWPVRRREPFLKALLKFCETRGRERTTLLSCQQLMQTAQGVLSDPLYALAVCLSAGTNDLDKVTENVVEYGSSSGTELCMGLLAGLHMAAAFCESERSEKW